MNPSQISYFLNSQWEVVPHYKPHLKTHEVWLIWGSKLLIQQRISFLLTIAQWYQKWLTISTDGQQCQFHWLAGLIYLKWVSYPNCCTYFNVYHFHHQQTSSQIWLKSSETSYGVADEQDYASSYSICHTTGEGWNSPISNGTTGLASLWQPPSGLSPVPPSHDWPWKEKYQLSYLFICICTW